MQFYIPCKYSSFFFIRKRTMSHNSVCHSNLCKYIWHKWCKPENRANKLTWHQNNEVAEAWGLIFTENWMLHLKDLEAKDVHLFISKLNQTIPPPLCQITADSVESICSKPVHRQSLNSSSSLTNFRFVLISCNFAHSATFIADQNFYF